MVAYILPTFWLVLFKTAIEKDTGTVSQDRPATSSRRR
jgi:hypothetical protein